MLHWYSIVVLSLLASCKCHEEISRILLVSMDGFRYDYLDLAHRFNVQTPNFDRLIAEGITVKKPGLTNVFITKTLPNHYSLVTGLYAESHGIVANTFYDPVFKEEFNVNTATDIKWWNGTGTEKVEPIWVTNEVAGNHRLSGVYFWPGGDVMGQHPKYFASPFNKSIPFETRIDTMINWFTQSVDPVCFGALYFGEPDESGHIFGPESIEIAKVVGRLDQSVGHLIEVLEAKQLLNDLNIILTSDHGMQQLNDVDIIYLDDYVDPSLYSAYAGSPVLHILPQEGWYEL